MSGLKLSNLVVLHLYNYIKPKGLQDPLKPIETICKSVKLSTCMRHIYVLDADALTTEEQKAAYDQLITFISKKDEYSSAITFERFDGQQAYEFLLSWMIAGKNAKKLFDDCRIIGDVRGIWEKMQHSRSLNTQTLVTHYRSFFNVLFADTVQMRKLISIFRDLNKEELGKN